MMTCTINPVYTKASQIKHLPQYNILSEWTQEMKQTLSTFAKFFHVPELLMRTVQRWSNQKMEPTVTSRKMATFTILIQ
jgi:hypothetical protein